MILTLRSASHHFTTSPLNRPLVVGCGLKCDWRLAGDFISDRHAEIYFRNGSWHIRALDDLSVTSVDGTPVQEPVRLAGGTTITIGSLQFEVSLDSPGDRPSAPPTRKCPFCAEEIPTEAAACRFCRRDLPAERTSPSPVRQAPPAWKTVPRRPIGTMAGRTPRAATQWTAGTVVRWSVGGLVFGGVLLALALALKHWSRREDPFRTVAAARPSESAASSRRQAPVPAPVPPPSDTIRPAGDPASAVAPAKPPRERPPDPKPPPPPQPDPVRFEMDETKTTPPPPAVKPPTITRLDRSESEVTIAWVESTETTGTVDGYHVDRKTPDEAEYTRLTKNPVRTMHYVDGTVRPETVYLYRVTAVQTRPPTEHACEPRRIETLAVVRLELKGVIKGAARPDGPPTLHAQIHVRKFLDGRWKSKSILVKAGDRIGSGPFETGCWIVSIKPAKDAQSGETGWQVIYRDARGKQWQLDTLTRP